MDLPSSYTPDGLLSRALEHERAILLGAATKVIETDFGKIVLNTDFPFAQSHNVILVDKQVGPRDLISQVEEVMNEAGIQFRVICTTDKTIADVLSPGLSEAGYSPSQDLLMGLLDASERKSDVRAELVPYDKVRPFIEASWRREGLEQEEARELADRVTTYRASCQVTHFGVRQERVDLVSCCELRKRGRTAQIEGIMTHPDWRGRGYATAVIQAAVKQAQDSGCDLMFLTTDADDWPQKLYRRLGFRDLGNTHCFEKALIG